MRLLYKHRMFSDLFDNVAKVFSGGMLQHFWVAHYNKEYKNVPYFECDSEDEETVEVEGKEEEQLE